MRILILTSSHPNKSAGIVAMDLYKGLKANKSNEIKILVKAFGKHDDANIRSLDSMVTFIKNRVFRKLKNILNRVPIFAMRTVKTDDNYYVQDYNQMVTYVDTKKLLKKADIHPDVIIVLFMQNFLSFKNLYELNKITSAPIFLYLMDMAPMTGGCHYAWDCQGYFEKCGNCPAILSSRIYDQSRDNWEYKNKYINNTDITVIAGSEQQYQQLCKSSLFKNKRKEKVLLGINSNLFHSYSKKIARQKLALPKSKRLVFIGAVNVASIRKGAVELLKALGYLKSMTTQKNNEVHLVIAGLTEEEYIFKLPYSYSLLGHLSYSQLALAFQAVDLFVSPSIEDSGPMMINQSIMSGTPVVAFGIGVALDLVLTGRTGYRAKFKDSLDFAYGINYILNLNKVEYENMRNNCSLLGEKCCSLEKQAKSFDALFNRDARSLSNE